MQNPEILKVPEDYLSLLQFLSTRRYTPVRAVMELRGAGWSHLYAAEGGHCYVVEDATGNWVVKALLMPDPGYEKYANLITTDASPLNGTGYLPNIAAHQPMPNGGSLTLLQRLHPLTDRRQSTLYTDQKRIREAVMLVNLHISFKQRLPDDGTRLLTEMLGKDDALHELVKILAMTTLLSKAVTTEWKVSDIMRDENGREVLLDPFNPYANGR